MESITPAELARRLQEPDPPALLDVREPEEHAFCALPGARLVPLGELPMRADELADWRDREIVVYCHHGIRSARAAGFLRQLELGFTRILNLAGGVDRWADEVDSKFPRY
ncbi:MAG: hypothetical protein KIT22_01290 [Verrucomicrobiae bacterium]|nr:hypothetical protein [Verrucomicrobiae bacterium]